MTLTQMQECYRATFLGKDGQVVLQDLMGKCFANQTTAVANERQSMLNEGHRQVWLHINTMLNLTPEQIARCQLGLPFIQGE
jgi:hypothetical protein